MIELNIPNARRITARAVHDCGAHRVTLTVYNTRGEAELNIYFFGDDAEKLADSYAAGINEVDKALFPPVTIASILRKNFPNWDGIA